MNTTLVKARSNLHVDTPFGEINRSFICRFSKLSFLNLWLHFPGKNAFSGLLWKHTINILWVSLKTSAMLGRWNNMYSVYFWTCTYTSSNSGQVHCQLLWNENISNKTTCLQFGGDFSFKTAQYEQTVIMRNHVTCLNFLFSVNIT